jgi:Aspartyl protease
MDSFRLYFLFLVSLLTASLAAAQNPALHGGPMLECAGLPCVEVTLASGKHLRLLIDTGDADSVIDAAVAKQMDLAVADANRPDGKPGSGYKTAVLTGVHLGDASLGDVKVMVADLSTFMKQDRMPASDGTIAYTAFKNRLLALDYRRRTVRVSEPLRAPLSCAGFCGTLSTPTFGKQGPAILAATGFSVNGEPITAQIDTLFSGTMLIYPTSVEKLHLGGAAQATEQDFFKYTDGGVHMLKTRSKTEAFGKNVLARDAALYFATAEVHLPDGMFDGTVGHALLARSALYLDFHGMKMWLAGSASSQSPAFFPAGPGTP